MASTSRMLSPMMSGIMGFFAGTAGLAGAATAGGAGAGGRTGVDIMRVNSPAPLWTVGGVGAAGGVGAIGRELCICP